MTKITCFVLTLLTAHALSDDNFDQVQMAMSSMKKAKSKKLSWYDSLGHEFQKAESKCEGCQGPSKKQCWNTCGSTVNGFQNGRGRCDQCDSKDGKFAGACCRKADGDQSKWHHDEEAVCKSLDPTHYTIEDFHHECVLIPDFPDCGTCRSEGVRVKCIRVKAKGYWQFNCEEPVTPKDPKRFMECYSFCGGGDPQKNGFTGWCSACNSKAGTRGACCQWNNKGDKEPCQWKEPDDDAQESKKQKKFLGIGYHVCVLPAEKHMKCIDIEYGFVTHGTAINSKKNKFAKSCPKNSPNVNPSAICSDELCDVEHDRITCCQPNTCTCNKGTPKGKKAGKCAVNLDEDCETCDPGYHLVTTTDKKQVCKKNVCSCKHGTETTSEGSGAYLCEKNGKEDCQKCDAGYHPNASFGVGLQKCVQNTCSCPGDNGDPSDGAGCVKHNTESCKRCKAGYDLKSVPDGTTKICYANTCQNVDTTKVQDAAHYDFSNCDNGVKTNEHCKVVCAKGYSGTDATYTCGTDGIIRGNVPKCDPQKCQGKLSNKIKSTLAVYKCDDVKTGGDCKVKCKAGYFAKDGDGNVVDTWTYKCTSEGWTGTEMTCEPKPCPGLNDADIANGKADQCGKTIAAGAQCNIQCDDGYTDKGITKCGAETYSDTATCVPKPCAVTAPDNGDLGGCGNTLESGGKCKFDCDAGYVPTETTCLLGKLTAGECKLKLSCPLQYTYACDEKYGFWTDADKYLDYDGCETYCNEMKEDKHDINGCELSGAGAGRSSKGQWCMAHLSDCSMTPNQQDNAAAKCDVYRN